jgi:hypothetical protein
MLRTALRPRRTAGLLGAGLVAGAVLTGCGSDATATAPAAATGPATAAPVADTAPDLADGLLPATAFGPDAAVTPVPAERLAHVGDLAGALALVQITPDSCATALRQVLPQAAGVSDAAAQVDRGADAVTAELLARPGAGVDAVGQLTALAGACSSAQVAAGQYGSGTVTVTPLDVPALGDGAAAVSVAVEASGPDGRAWSGTGLAAVVQDGDRVLALAQGAPAGRAVDPGAFTTLLQQAFRTQADALD